MSPRLVLLTGPAAGEVAKVLREMVNGDALRYVTGNGPASTWDEVRDYWEAICRISDCGWHGAHGPSCMGRKGCSSIDKVIRSLPGGEEWLVGLVLPGPCDGCGGGIDCECWPGDLERLPARLAILAPDPPPLLVERVLLWGGIVWECRTDVGAYCSILKRGRPAPRGESNWSNGDTWPEAVRAALGES